jgi:hypothetical protein
MKEGQAMKWWIAAVLALGIGTAHAEQSELLVYYEDLIKDGFQIIGITPDGKGGQVYHMQKPDNPLYTCRAEVLVHGLEPIMDKYCRKVM